MYCIKKYRYLESCENPSSPTCGKSWSEEPEIGMSEAMHEACESTYEVRMVNVGQDGVL